MRLLIIDESILVIERLIELLSDEAVVSSIYSSGSYEKGLDLFINSSPDIVLLGIAVPAKNSLRALKKMKEGPAPPVVMMLAINLDQHVCQQCLLSGADYVMDKYRDFGKIGPIISKLAAERNRKAQGRDGIVKTKSQIGVCKKGAGET